MSCRRGDSDFALQEGGNGTLPPPCPRVGGDPSSRSCVALPALSVIAAITPWGVGEGGKGGAIKEISNNDIAARAGCGRGGPALSNLPL